MSADQVAARVPEGAIWPVAYLTRVCALATIVLVGAAAVSVSPEHADMDTVSQETGLGEVDPGRSDR